MLADFEIREKLIANIKSRNRHHYRIIEELCICDGEVRADVVLANGSLQGFEIKSDLDSFTRLAKQIESYDKTFEKNTLIVGEKHLDKALLVVPDHWGIYLASKYRNGSVKIKIVRRPKKNPYLRAEDLSSLLWNTEIKLLLKKNKVGGYSKKNRPQLIELMNQSIRFSELRDYTLNTLKTRLGWREDLL